MTDPHQRPDAIEVRFVRSEGARDRIWVTRPDGSQASWAFPSFGDTLPHDLVHLVIERHVELRDGVWGLVAGGVDLERINAIANRRGGAGKYEAALGTSCDDLYRAEALAIAPWLTADPPTLRTSVAEVCRDAGVHAPEITDAAFEAIRSELLELLPRWRALRPKGTLVLHYCRPRTDR